MNRDRILYVVPVLAVFFSLMVVAPRPVLAQTEKGIELYNTWKFPEAEKALRDALKANPRDAAASYYLGLSLLLQDKHSEALDVFLKVKDAQEKAERKTRPPVPDEYQIQIALARTFLELKQFPDALKVLESAQKEHSDSADVYVYLGYYYLQQEKLPQAIQELEKAISLDAQNAYAHYYAGHAYLRSGNPVKAVEMFKVFLILAPRAPEAPKAKALVEALC